LGEGASVGGQKKKKKMGQKTNLNLKKRGIPYVVGRRPRWGKKGGNKRGRGVHFIGREKGGFRERWPVTERKKTGQGRQKGSISCQVFAPAKGRPLHGENCRSQKAYVNLHRERTRLLRGKKGTPCQPSLCWVGGNPLEKNGRKRKEKDIFFEGGVCDL